MDVLSSHDDRPPWRPRLSAPLAVALALAAVSVGQAVTVLRPQPLATGAAVEALPNGYSYAVDGELAMIGFQLRNGGERAVRVLGIGADLPGLRLVDVGASGEPFRFELVGVGPEPLPAFDLPPGTVIEVNLSYRVGRCADVPGDDRPVPVRARTGRGEGVLALRLPGQPAEAIDAGPDDEDPWQRVLVRDLC
jgi:hypothetical protein